MLSVESFWLNFQNNVPSLKLVENSNTSFLLAYSGGKDSHVLLHLFAELKRRSIIQDIRAIHINHQLHDDSSTWAQHCLHQCSEYNIPCEVVNVNVDNSKGVSIEAAARTERYTVFKEKLMTDEVLVTAQHADDQVETFLLQTLRGSGVKGLASMPMLKKMAKGFLCRPFLDINQSDITEYALANKLHWLDDPSNDDTRFDRNFLRKKILPELKQRWPSINNTINRVTRFQAEAATLQEDLAVIDLDGLNAEGNRLPISLLAKLSLVRQKNVLRYWLHNMLKHSMPDSNHLLRIINEVMASALDAQPCVQWGNVIVRRHQDFLYADSNTSIYNNHAIDNFNYKKEKTDLGGRCLVSEKVIGNGLSIDSLKNKNVSIRFRQGGETCRPQGREQHTHKLKTLLQEWGVPPWQRDSIPLVFIENELAQVVGYCTCVPFSVAQDEEGYCISLVDKSGK